MQNSDSGNTQTESNLLGGEYQLVDSSTEPDEASEQGPGQNQYNIQFFDSYASVEFTLRTEEWEDVQPLKHVRNRQHLPSDVNAIISRLYHEQHTFIGHVIDDSAQGLELEIFQTDTKRLILFPVVKDYEIVGVQNNTLPPLDSALTFYKSQTALHMPNNRLIIPVGESARKHLRLLDIDIESSKVTYYDSRDFLLTSVMSTIAPAKPAWFAAKALFNQLAADKEPELHEMVERRLREMDEKKATTPIEVFEEKWVNTHIVMKLLYVLSELMVYSAHKAVISYGEYANFIKQVCLEHYPTFSFITKTMGEQPWSEDNSCGPLAARCAETIAAEKRLYPEEDIMGMLTRFHFLLDDKETSTAVQVEVPDIVAHYT